MGLGQKKSYSVLHILVAHKYQAEDILRIWHGKKVDREVFASAAEQHSLCPSSKQGGDLGRIVFGRADSDFEEACLSLRLGQLTMVPVRTRHGYHLIYRYD